MYGLNFSIPVLGTRRRHAASVNQPGFSPQSLSPLAWWDISDLSTLYQDAAGTNPVTTSGDPVALVQDKSGNGHHLAQETPASRPVWQNGGAIWLENANTNGNGLALSTALDVKTIIGAFQYQTGSQATFANYPTLFCETDTGKETSRIMGSSGGADLHFPAFPASVSGAGYATTVLPLPWSVVAVKRADENVWQTKHVASKNNNQTTRRWIGRFAPIAAFNRILTSGEITELRSWAQSRFNTA